MTIVDVYPNVMRGSFTQGGIDLFVEETILTGLSAVTSADLMQQAAEDRKKKGMPDTIVAMELLKLRYHGMQTFNANGEYSRFGVSTVSEAAAAAVPNLNARGAIAREDKYFLAPTDTTGFQFYEINEVIDFTSGGMGRIVASRNLYLTYDTNGAGAAHTIYYQLEFRYVNLNFYEFYQIQEGQRDLT